MLINLSKMNALQSYMRAFFEIHSMDVRNLEFRIKKIDSCQYLLMSFKCCYIDDSMLSKIHAVFPSVYTIGTVEGTLYVSFVLIHNPELPADSTNIYE